MRDESRDVGASGRWATARRLGARFARWAGQRRDGGTVEFLDERRSRTVRGGEIRRAWVWEIERRVRRERGAMGRARERYD